MAISPELLEILRCPRCRGRLALAPDGGALRCAACALAYPVCDGIPVMIVDEATALPAPRGGDAGP
jgi:uncharacterized protein YbaR (Trm112 family)